MKRGWFRWWWAILVLPMAVGLARLHFDADVLNLLPTSIPAVQGLKIYQEHFANSRELIITLQAPDADAAKSAAQSIASKLRLETNLVADATWQPPWLEHPEQMAELIGYLWLNQPPGVFRRLADNLAETNLANVLNATRERLATTLSPTDLAQLSYDPFGLTQLPADIAGAAPGFGQGQGMFASADGTFRIIFVKAATDLTGYRECAAWLDAIREIADSSLPPSSRVNINYTGRPAFVAEISASMKHDIILSVGGTAMIIALLFWLAHRRWKPMLWLLTLLALILGGTLALGSLILGAINVVSMGFAAILLGLAVDYAVVHYQEALAYPNLTVPEIRRAIAPSIFWAATTTICAFFVLNFGGLPGLAQLGSLVAIGIALSALVMIMAFLPPLFPDRMVRHGAPPPPETEPTAEPLHPLRAKLVFFATGALVLLSVIALSRGWPKMDASTRAMEPRHSEAYAALDAIKVNLGQKQEPLWLVVSGRDESEVARRLAAVKPALDNAVSNHWLTGFTLPDTLWPRPEMQAANRPIAQRLLAESDTMKTAALANGFTADALGLNGKIMETWRQAATTTNVFWPTNAASQWIFEKIAAHDLRDFFAAGFLYPAAGLVDPTVIRPLPDEGVWLSSWSLLGRAVLDKVKHNLWKVLVPMVSLVLLSLWLAFGRLPEMCLSLGTLLLSGLCLLAAMKIAGWSWNVLNLMALPLLLGTGVDYSLFMQLALRRHDGSLAAARHSVGRALLLCGGTAVAGFGSLGFSSNAGMASLGQICAAGLAGNMLISIFLLPVWWKILACKKPAGVTPPAPSQLYGGTIWKMGLLLGRHLPAAAGRMLARGGAAIYWRLAPHRRAVVVQNLLPVLKDDPAAATRAARALFTEFALKVSDLWRYEAGVDLDNWVMHWKGWEIYLAAQKRGRGVLLVTPHLGNWEIGGAFLPRKGYKLLVLTQPEPDARLTEIRLAARAFRGVETIVVGEDAFAFIEIIKRLQGGATVALLMDRPAAPTAVTVNLFGRPFLASIAAAELARASGCAILPGCIVRKSDYSYEGEIQPEIQYDRAAIGNRAARVQLTQEIMRVFEPAIQQYITQWYHFVPIWPAPAEK